MQFLILGPLHVDTIFRFMYASGFVIVACTDAVCTAKCRVSTHVQGAYLAPIMNAVSVCV